MTSPGAAVARFGWLANICAVISLLMCYGKAVLFAVLGALGILATDAAVPHIQAVLMWGFASLSVAGLALDRKQHGTSLPLGLGVSGTIVMIGTLYAYYDWRILTFAYLLIISAIFFNQTVALKGLYGTVQSQAKELEEWNERLSRRVDEQVDRIQRLDRLKRFLSPQVAELITGSADESPLASHRQFITAVFCDLRGFTALSEQVEPEEAMDLLSQYHEILGELIYAFGGTIDHRAGDGIMVIFNDPVPCETPELQSVKLAIAMRERVRELTQKWRKRGYEVGFGVGIASGYATLGIVGHEGRFDYTANGNSVNLAARLCDEALGDQIIISDKTLAEIEDLVDAEPLPELHLKGISRPVRAFNVTRIRETESERASA